MKICKRCETEKSKSEFNKRRTSKDGLQSYCRDCSRTLNRETRQNDLQNIRERERLYERENRKKRNAKAAVRYALKTGKIKKIEVCEVCNTNLAQDGHHEDYDKPLDVTWCCKSCHRNIHLGEIVL